ncbi:phage integrase SAM-like domain-containing protein [Mucilaginibacter sp.]|uniref:phage integrase SAM-like domain-containing protein n=1 Tax=Mucilaginibacter sp. TaxID=1882438 RepID=UPI003D0F568E
MATVGIKIHKHHKKADGTYNVKIRVAHKGEKKYIDTPHFVVDKQLTAKFILKDAILKQIINKTLDDYRVTISNLGPKLELFNPEDLRNHLRDKNEPMDFFKFCNDHIEGLKKQGRKGSAGTLNTVLLSLQDYFKGNSISPLEINEWMLNAYEKYLRAERKFERLNQGRLITRTVKGMCDAAVHNHFRDLRILFKAAMKFYNKPQIGEIKIPYCPFDNYKIVDAPETKKRNLTIEQLKTIRDCKVPDDSRAELAQDLFMLSFYLCGMNAVDLYNLRACNIKKGRVDYNRSKTIRRSDKAFISIKLVKEAKPLLNKYLEKLHTRYNSFENLDRAINEGMKSVNEKAKLSGITFYWARHTFANLGRNKCRMSKDDVGLALNHMDQGNKTTDIYIEKDWSIVDEVQSNVIALLSEPNEHKIKKITSTIELRKTMRIVGT